ncbi:MAG: hypothetical protein K0U74_02700 [Alphaproteobacteria bacterium]|nr:hypothetical protein [Alphaproteobacteria bacterium]
MKATELKSVVSDLADLFRAGGANAPAKDLDILADRIETTGGKTADQALDQLDREIDQATQKKLSPPHYVKALKDAGLNEAAFLKIFGMFKNDKSIKKADAIEVMKGYAGQHVRARTKAEAIDEVERKFTELVYDDNSHRQAAETTPW